MAGKSNSASGGAKTGKAINFKADGIKIAKCGSEAVAEQVIKGLTALGVTNLKMDADKVVLNQATAAKPYREAKIAAIVEAAKHMTGVAKKVAS